MHTYIHTYIRTLLLDTKLCSYIHTYFIVTYEIMFIHTYILYCYIQNYVHTYILCFPLNQNLVRVIVGCGTSNTIIHKKYKNIKFTLQGIISILRNVFTCYKKNLLQLII